MIGEIVSHYRILSRLGAGGMGVVYEAEDTRLGRRVAVKFLPDDSGVSPDAAQRFFREARVISSLTHPHICTLYDIGEHHSHRFMVMELLDGESLRARIDRGSLPFDEVLRLGEQMADALDTAHSEGVVHRDIKPANLFLTKRGLLKVLDFGIAKLSRARGETSETTVGGSDQLTTAGSTVGTIAYMSPEQARGHEIDARSDLFSAGIVLYEMATRKLPFAGATPATIFEGILTKSAVPPSQLEPALPAAFDHVIARALEKDRDTRYQSAADLGAELKRLRKATESGAIASASTGPVSTGRTPSADSSAAAQTQPRHWLKPALVGVPLVTLAAVGALFFYRSVSTPAFAAKDPVVLAAVTNRTGDAMFDDTLGEALGVQLRQSPFLTVVADQQVQSTLRLMGRDPMTPLTGEVGRELCQRVAAKALLGGSIAMLGSSYVVTLSAQDCLTGRVLAERQVQSDSKENVLKALGSGVSALRENLGESLASIQRHDSQVEEATTRSLDALKAYSQGVRTRRTTGDFDSVPFFRRAIELDPEFALAYARLGTVFNNLTQLEEGRRMTTKAFELRNKVSDAERAYIEARYYTTVEQDFTKAAETYRVLLATYPDDYSSLVNLGSLLRNLGQEDDAIRQLEHAVRIGADQPLAWQNLSNAYFDTGRYQDSRKAIDTALKLQDSTNTRAGLYTLAIVTGDRALAEAQVAAVQGRRDEVTMVVTRMAGATYLGKMKEADALVADVQSRMDQASLGERSGERVLDLAINEALAGLTDVARTRAVRARTSGLVGPAVLDEDLMLSALLQDRARAKAVFSGAVDEAKKSISNPARRLEVARFMESLLALAESRPADAATLLEPLTFDAAHIQQVAIWCIAQLRLQHWLEASKGLEWMVQKDLRNGLNVSKAYALASLARARAALGQTAEARKIYLQFFDFWKDADPDVPMLVRAKEEFAKVP
jgi:serine/threonine protein kinase/tetratricopeptide (TPR) repeat protein